jgi:hypothetical protein
MKKLTKYQCEICENLFDNPKEASKCEIKGSPGILAKVGDIVLYRDDWNGGFGTSYDKTDVIEIEVHGHDVTYQLGDFKTGYPCEAVWGNEEFSDKCQIIGSHKPLETLDS